MAMSISARALAAFGSAIALLAIALPALTDGGALAADNDDTFYRGKQIRLVVSTDTGGAYDNYARIMAPIFREHIPGNPTVIVQNMPGASGLKAANYMAALAPRDGTVIASAQASILTLQFTSPGSTAFDANKFAWIGSITNDPFIGYVWHTSPIRTLEDTKTIPSVMGGVEIGAASTDYGDHGARHVRAEVQGGERLQELTRRKTRDGAW